MSNLNFNSYDEFCETMHRGNEIIFKFHDRVFTVCPHYLNDQIIDGCIIGEAYSDNFDVVPFSSLSMFCVLGKALGDIIGEIEVLDRVI